MSASVHALAVLRLEQLLSLVALPHLAGTFVEEGQWLARGLAELGILSEDERRVWGTRFDQAAEALVPYPADVRARGRELLEDELTETAADPAEVLERRERFGDLLQALLETGIVDWADQAGWMGRLDEALAPPPNVTHPPPPYLARELRAVAVAPPERIGGLRVTSVELYDDCIWLRWHLLAPNEPRWQTSVHIIDHALDLAREHRPQVLRDDLGTRYTKTPGEILEDLDFDHLTHNPGVLLGVTAFTPQVPQHATRLTVHHHDDIIDIELPTT